MPPTSFAPRPAEGLNFANVVQMFAARVRKSPDATALRHKKDGTWRATTWAEWERSSEALAAALLDLGIERGDRIALMSRTRVEWVLWDLAIAMAGAVSVPIYPSVTGADAGFILADSGAKIAVLEDVRVLRSVSEHAGAAGVEAMVLFQGDATESDFKVLHHAELMRTEVTRSARERLSRERGALGLLDTMTLSYTSGTTGRPKGVTLTHKNVVYEAWAIKNIIAADHRDEHLVILPLAHIFARHMIWAAVESGAVTAFAEGPEAVESNLREIAPTYLGAVPRVYEKLYTQILREVADAGPLKQAAFAWAMKIGRRVSVCVQRGQPVPATLALRMRAARRTVFDPISAGFGGRLRFLISGAAPLSREVTEFFHAAGLLILEGYGLTETAGATHVNRPDRFRFGTVGPALPGCEVLLAEDGEILLRGHNVMAGYHGLPEETAAVLDEDGWLHTGDLGVLSEGFLRITGRKKDVIITAGGKNIAPQKLEARLLEIKGVSRAMVVGDRRPYVVALLDLDVDVMMARSDHEGLGCRSAGDLARHPRIREYLDKEVAVVNADLARYETIKRFGVFPRALEQARGELTPTGKVRRAPVAEHFAELLERLYEDADASASTSRG